MIADAVAVALMVPDVEWEILMFLGTCALLTLRMACDHTGPFGAFPYHNSLTHGPSDRHDDTPNVPASCWWAVVAVDDMDSSDDDRDSYWTIVPLDSMRILWRLQPLMMMKDLVRPVAPRACFSSIVVTAVVNLLLVVAVVVNLLLAHLVAPRACSAAALVNLLLAVAHHHHHHHHWCHHWY